MYRIINNNLIKFKIFHLSRNYEINNFIILRKNLFNFMEKNLIQNSMNFSYDKYNIFSYDILKYQIKEKIDLNENESKIFNTINEVLSKNNKNTICRVAGGWVRDKVYKKSN